MLSALKSSSIARAVSRPLKSSSPLSRWATSANTRAPTQLAFRASLPRCNHSASSHNSHSIACGRKEEQHSSSTSIPRPTEPAPQDEPKMAIAFTCTVPKCGHRQAHMFSKRSYEKGIVIVTCSGCKNRHLIADHLGWFDNLTGDGANVTIEKLAKAHGVPVTRGSVGESGVFEYDGEAPFDSPEEP